MWSDNASAARSDHIAALSVSTRWFIVAALFLSLAFLVVLIETATALSPVVPGEHHALEQWRRRLVRCLELVVEDIRGVVLRIQPDIVEEREWSHRMTESALYGLVDLVRRRDALLERPDRRVQIWDQQAIHDEARRVLAHDAGLSDPRGVLAKRRERRLARRDRSHDLDELHDLHRIEEVESGETVRALRRRRKLGDRHGGGVAREDRVRRAHRVELPIHRFLYAEILGHRLD